VDGNSVLIVITGPPNTNYLCTQSSDLKVFTEIETSPSIVQTSSAGTASFIVTNDGGKKFFLIEEKP
jgi:hypothetical protein